MPPGVKALTGLSQSAQGEGNIERWTNSGSDFDNAVSRAASRARAGAERTGVDMGSFVFDGDAPSEAATDAVEQHPGGYSVTKGSSMAADGNIGSATGSHAAVRNPAALVITPQSSLARLWRTANAAIEDNTRGYQNLANPVLSPVYVTGAQGRVYVFRPTSVQ